VAHALLLSDYLHQLESIVPNTANSPNEPDRDADEDPGGPPAEVSKPIGDAIPTPVEPGLDQPLPKKGEDLPPDTNKPGQPGNDPLGDADARPGVPKPGPSDFA
jgi:hypothetical protein